MATTATAARPQPAAAPTCNRNAYAGANIGVPCSPLEGVTSLDPNDYVWNVPSSRGCAALAAHAMWHQLGAMALFQGAAWAWPMGLAPGLPMPGVAPVRGMMPACMPGFPVQISGQWNTMQQPAPFDCHDQGQPEGTAAQKGTTAQASGQLAVAASKATGGKAVEGQKMQKSIHKQKSVKAKVVSAAWGASVDQCSEDFLDSVMDLNEDDIQHLLQEPMDTLVEGSLHLESLNSVPGHMVSQNSESSAFNLQQSASCASQHSETLPDDSMLFLNDLELSCLKEVNSFPDLTELECLKVDTEECVDSKEGARQAFKAAGKRRKKKSGVCKRRGPKGRTAVPMFVDDECLKELEQMLGTGLSAGAFGGKPKNASSVLPKIDGMGMTGKEKSNGVKSVQRSGGRKTPQPLKHT